MNSVLTVAGLVASGLMLTSRVFAASPTPTIYEVPDGVEQILVNIFASIQAAIFTVFGWVMPYAIPLMLLFFALGLGLYIFNRFRGGAH